MSRRLVANADAVLRDVAALRKSIAVFARPVKQLDMRELDAQLAAIADEVRRLRDVWAGA